MNMQVKYNSDGPITEEVFNQDPALFMNNLIGSMVAMRVRELQADRLERIFGREFIVDILSKDTWSWEDYNTVLDCCI